MLKVVDETFTASLPPPSLLEISRHVREAAEHLAEAYNMIADTDLEDRRQLEFAIFETAGKLSLILVAVTKEVVAVNKPR